MGNGEKYKRNMCCLDKWLSNHEQKKRIGDYLDSCHIHRVGIYGYGMLGRHLVRDLQGQGIPIGWVMDRAALGDDVYSNPVRPDALDKPEDVDLAVITTLADVEEAEAVLMRFVTGRIISLEELVECIYVWGNQN